MTGRLVRWWAWIGEHRLSAGWLVVVLGFVLFGGGVALGATLEPPPLVQAVAPPPDVARPRAVAVEAVVIGRRSAGFAVRTKDGDRLIVRTSEVTTYRIRGKATDATAIRRGTRVLVLGRSTNQDHVIRARVVAVRGMARPPVPSPEALAPAR